jgi:undecaprenyl-diphosphatase
MQAFIVFDQKITQFLNLLLPHNSFFDYFFSFFSMKGSAIVVWILVIIFAVIFEEKKHPGISNNDKKFILIFLTAFLTTSLLVEFPLKNFFRRQRPITTNFNQLQLISTHSNCPSDFSFPSGHASTAFAAATVLAYFDKKRRFLYYTIATLIAFSRIYLGCHYFFDVLAGAIFGYLISKLILNLKNN